jgi:hypothetical protein
MVRLDLEKQGVHSDLVPAMSYLAMVIKDAYYKVAGTREPRDRRF